ncbi:MAG TPA: glycosyltransferase family 4 protein [Acidimicrobiales bacterium]|nr:glycosyltransferase family 4 protein [Acidimicrobiales bacterium]HLH47064.1 glycosyltransferase family 4 protein [Acidimicrobiales bacterium]
MRRHLLVTNDFPPKVGGIQAYLWELWRRLDPASFAVLTARSHPDHARFDADVARSGFHVERVRSPILYFPTPLSARRVRRTADTLGASLVVLDPALPLGLLGPRVQLPYAVVLHGAEVVAPARLPVARQLLARTVRGASLVVSAGTYPESEVRRAIGGRLPPVVHVPPGVDCGRFTPLSPPERARARAALGLPAGGPLVVSVSRLVPRKGMDVLIEAASRLAPSFPDLTVAIAGSGRDAGRLERLAARAAAPVRLLGRVAEADKPLLLAAADVFVMACRNRWGGLEQEGFGIVFLEAAAAGVPQIAGDSGGAAEAVEDGVTGLVLRRPGDPGELAFALRRLLGDDALRARLGSEARRRAQASFDYDRLAGRLAEALAQVGG